ncbi:lytic murein transglycosylase, partial [bacterium]|nr:lytic murein transglycosylase [bacterium]
LFAQADGLLLTNVPDPESWLISPFAIYRSDGTPVNSYVTQLIKNLESREGPGVPVYEEEFAEYLRWHPEPAAYAAQLLKYASPRSKKNQDSAHSTYANRLMKPHLIRSGVEFMEKNDSLLTVAEKRFRVRRQDIVGILMWESGLGSNTGNFRVFNIFMGQLLYLNQAEHVAIARMMRKGYADVPELGEQSKRFHRLKRNAMRNMVALMRLSKASGTDPLEQYGSWGGAIGFPQFMPASLQFAIDADGDGQVNLYEWPDAIFSVANYLHVNRYGTAKKARRRAIFSYNRLDSYVNGVIQYADAISKQYYQ